MGDILIFEASQHVDDGISLADVAEKLVAQTFALACTFHQSGDVYNLAGGRHDASRMYYLGKFSESFVGHGDDAHVRFYCTKGEVGCLSLGARQTVKECGLAHVRQSHYTTF